MDRVNCWGMNALLPAVRTLGDESRLRILLLLAQEELSVNELQEILAMGQSRISMHLSQLKQSGLVALRKAGKNNLYRMAPLPASAQVVTEIMKRGRQELPEASADRDALRLVLKRRKDRMRQYFDELAGKFGRHYVPGRSWQGVTEMLLRLLPPLVIADLGAGEGTISLLLAQRAERVIAVDNSEKMLAVARAAAEKAHVSNVEYRLGDLEDLPLPDGSVDLALFSQSLHHALHPEVAVKEAFRIVRPGGKLLVLDLLRHGVEEARELYADVWLGFAKTELESYLKQAKFRHIEVTVVHKEEAHPHFETLLAVGEKPA